MKLDYERDIRIDETALDTEWLGQAELAVKYGREVARLRRKVKDLAERKKITRSELILEANADPEGTIGKKKPNAGDLESYYRTNRRYKELMEDLIEAEEELEMAEVAKDEIRFTRKAALENMVTLHGQMYFAGPNVPRNIKEEMNKFREAQQGRADKAIGTKMRRKK